MQQLSSTSPLPHSQRGNGREGGGEVGLRRRGGKKERERGGLGSGNDLHIPWAASGFSRLGCLLWLPRCSKVISSNFRKKHNAGGGALAANNTHTHTQINNVFAAYPWVSCNKPLCQPCPCEEHSPDSFGWLSSCSSSALPWERGARSRSAWRIWSWKSTLLWRNGRKINETCQKRESHVWFWRNLTPQIHTRQKKQCDTSTIKHFMLYVHLQKQRFYIFFWTLEGWGVGVEKFE